MISPNEFRERWCDDDDRESLVVYPHEALGALSFPEDSRAFLTSIGLPESAPPFLDFRRRITGTLRTAAEL